MVRKSRRYFALAVILSFLLFWLLGNFSPSMTPDTDGYLESQPWPAMLGMMRTPFYGWFVSLLGGSATAYALVPVAHYLLVVGAAVMLFRAVEVFGAGAWAAFSLATPVLFSNTVFLYGGDVHPETPTVALIVMAIAWTLLWCRRFHPADLVGVAVSLGLAYIIKPAFLPFMLSLPALALALLRLRQVPWRRAILAALLLGIVGSLPFGLYAGLRATMVGSFNVVSFGGFNLSGLAGLMLRDETVERLPETERPLARHILAEREKLSSEGILMPLPLNSHNERSFRSTALGYFDILARSYDVVLYQIIAPTRGATESWIALDRRLQRFAVSVIKADPVSYATWIVGATTRFTGLVVAQNVSLIASGLFFFAAWTRRLLSPSPAVPWSEAHTLVGLITAFYTTTTYIPCVLAAFPAHRYTDGAGLFLASLLLMLTPRRGGIQGGPRPPLALLPVFFKRPRRPPP